MKALRGSIQWPYTITSWATPRVCRKYDTSGLRKYSPSWRTTAFFLLLLMGLSNGAVEERTRSANMQGYGSLVISRRSYEEKECDGILKVGWFEWQSIIAGF